MRKRIGIYGASDEALALIPLLGANPSVEIAAIWTAEPLRVLERLPHFEPGVAALLEQTLSDDAESIAGDPHLHAVVDAGVDRPFGERFPEAAERGLQIVSPLTARLLWGYGAASAGDKGELLRALHEVVESYSLTVDPDELFTRMLEIALSVTGAEDGSLMLLDAERGELRVRVASGVEPELWPKIRPRLGEGIAGRVAAEARPLRLRGKADRQAFRIVHERLDVESALSVPLVHEGRVLGVLNLHHGTRPDAFGEEDLAFAEQLAHLDAQIIARAQEHESLRSQAARYAAVREVRRILSGRAPLPRRLGELCRFVASQTGDGIATTYLHDPDEGALRMAATSLEGGGFAGEYRVAPGEGIDGRVARSREPAFLYERPYERPSTGSGSHARLAYAALPLVAGDTLVGVLSLQAGPEAPSGRGAEETLLEIAAAAAEEVAQAEREAHIAARATKVGAINEAGMRMIAASDASEVLRLGTSSAAMVLEADHAVLRLEDEATRRYVIRSYFGAADGRLQEKLFALDRRVSVDVLKRRAPLLVRQLEEEEVRSLLAAPLRREGRVIGTLALYDKAPGDRFYPTRFGDADVELFTRFVSYLERALANALFVAQARRFRNFDEETGLPNESYLGKRLREEIARAGHRPGSLSLAVARLENADELAQAADPALLRRAVERLAASLRERARDFDVVARAGRAEFAVLMPEPGTDPGERVFELARAVSDDVSKDEDLNQPVRISLAFGYAVHPEDGEDADALLSRARDPRIRMM